MEKKIKIEKKSGHTETTIVSNEVPIVIPVRDKNGYEVELRDKLKALVCTAPTQINLTPRFTN